MGKSGNPAKRAEQEAAPPVSIVDNDAEAPNLEDFDEFWDTRDRGVRTTTIMGEAVELPPALPLQFELEARRIQRSKRGKDVRKLVAILFGADALARWAERGMDLEQFMVLLAWAPGAISGDPRPLAEIADEVAQRLREDDEGDESGEEPDPT